jgi:hypothetical protein
VSLVYARSLVVDPTGEQDLARRRQYTPRCRDCGRQSHGDRCRECHEKASNPRLEPVAVETLAYFAGLMDGEGHIGIRRSHDGRWHDLVVNISNTNKAVLEEMASHFGGNVQVQRQRQKPVYRWNSSGRRAVLVLSMLLPHLRIKRAEAEVGLAFQTDRQNGEAYRERLFELRGGAQPHAHLLPGRPKAA